jgi:hypothetical protein
MEKCGKWANCGVFPEAFSATRLREWSVQQDPQFSLREQISGLRCKPIAALHWLRIDKVAKRQPWRKSQASKK